MCDAETGCVRLLINELSGLGGPFFLFKTTVLGIGCALALANAMARETFETFGLWLFVDPDN